MSNGLPPHGGNLSQEARRLGMKPSQLLDASASLVPFRPPRALRRALAAAIQGQALRDYPDRAQADLRSAIASWHGLDPDQVLAGNGAAELFTWAARDATAAGLSVLLQPGFADYSRALACWGGAIEARPLPLAWGDGWPQSFPLGALKETGDVMWITNPHNPTGQLWSRCSLEPLLARYSLVICDEAFLPLVPGGEDQSLLPLVADHPNLVVIRSLTKLFAIAGLRLGYAVAAADRLQRWHGWRDPWPVNGLAIAAGVAVMNDRVGLQRWQQRVQQWVQQEGSWFRAQLDAIPGVNPYPSAANYLLIQGEQSLLELRERLALDGVLLRDCRSFAGLGECWLRIGLQDRRGNQRILRALQRAQANRAWSRATSF
ncbi:histidinol-phosphate transaminase [Synechococcus sp. UW179B]|uniref:pyridoxal phosphate-dependent aminotransferase n=1 Tax=Synechococcus sp. UW179B TaxID=2575516 RepID=UPI0014835BB6|nr:aminotransferase class I/II-fold pyridoxal phosphate-dependent enzyme [Synechococcus sp. UW179B]